jgi:HSP20 family protein
MALSRYNNPGYGLSLRNAMDQLLTQAFVNPMTFMGPQSMVAPMNVYETNNGYEVQVALAGVKPQDIDLTVQQNTLDIKGKFSYTMPQTAQGQQASNVVESQPGQQSKGQQAQQTQAQGQSQSQSQQGQANFTTLVQEIPMGNFERTITFPRAIDANQIHTSFENGILTIWVPVSEASRARKISVHSGQTGQTAQSGQPQHVSVSQS